MGTITGMITNNEKRVYTDPKTNISREYRDFEIDDIRFDLDDNTEKFPIGIYHEVTVVYRLMYKPAKDGLKRPARVVSSIKEVK